MLYTEIDRIQTQTGLYRLAINNSLRRLYVTTANTIDVIELDTRIIHKHSWWEYGSLLHIGYLVVNPKSGRIYATDDSDGTGKMYVFDASDAIDFPRLLFTLQLDHEKYDMVIDTKRNRLYATDFIESTVSIVDLEPGSPSENTIIQTIRVERNLTEIAVNEEDGRVYVLSAEGAVHVVDVVNYNLIATINIEKMLHGIAFDPVTKKLYFGASDQFDSNYATANCEIKIVDVEIGSSTENTIVDSIPVEGAGVMRLASKPGKIIFVANGNGPLTIIDAQNDKILQTIPYQGGVYLRDVAIDSSGLVYVTDVPEESISVLSSVTAHRPPIDKHKRAKYRVKGHVSRLDAYMVSTLVLKIIGTPTDAGFWAITPRGIMKKIPPWNTQVAKELRQVRENIIQNIKTYRSLSSSLMKPTKNKTLRKTKKR